MVPLKASSYLSWAHDPYLMWFDEALKWVAFEKPVFGFFSLPGVKLAIWLLAVMWAFGVVWCAIWVGRSFIHESFTVFWPIKVGLWSSPAARAALLTALLPAQMILVMAHKAYCCKWAGHRVPKTVHHLLFLLRLSFLSLSLFSALHKFGEGVPRACKPH